MNPVNSLVLALRKEKIAFSKPIKKQTSAKALISILLIGLFAAILININFGSQNIAYAATTFTAQLGDNEVPPSNSTAKGQANFILSADGLSMRYVIQVSNITNATAAHIHAGAAGVNGGIVVLLFPIPPATAKNGSFTGILAEGNFTAANFTGTLAGQPFSTLLAMMNNGTAYVNVHTTQFPGGEIRGQIARTFSAQLGNYEVPPSNSTTTGQANFTLSANGLSIQYVIQVSNITNATAAHIHTGAPNPHPGIVVLLFPIPPATAKNGSFTGILAEGNFTAANMTGTLAGQPLSTLIAMMDNGTAYVNVHTTQFPGGEIRGQIGGQAAPTPTPTPSPSPSPTTTPTPSPTPTPTPTPIPSPTPNPLNIPLAASAFTDVSILPGQFWYFVVHAWGGTFDYKFQWYQGTTLLPGETQQLIRATQTTPGTYAYSCRVTDTRGATATSNTITLTVINISIPPQIPSPTPAPTPTPTPAPTPTATPTPTPTPTPAPKVNVTIYAGNTSTGLGFGNTTNTIQSPGPALTFKVGSNVTLTLINAMPTTQHNWAMVDARSATANVVFGARVNIIPGGGNGTITFTPTQAGNYYYICQIAGHFAAGMWGNVTVIP